MGSRRPPQRWLLSHMNNCATSSLPLCAIHLMSQVCPLSSRISGLPPPALCSVPALTTGALTDCADSRPAETAPVEVRSARTVIGAVNSLDPVTVVAAYAGSGPLTVASPVATRFPADTAL